MTRKKTNWEKQLLFVLLSDLAFFLGSAVLLSSTPLYFVMGFERIVNIVFGLVSLPLLFIWTSQWNWLCGCFEDTCCTIDNFISDTDFRFVRLLYYYTYRYPSKPAIDFTDDTEHGLFQ